MSGILTTAAQRTNADTAGRTTHPGESTPGEPAAATPTEMVHSVVHTASGALDSLFRQEPLSLTPASSAEVTASTATKGPHGGLVPASVSNIVRGTLAPSPGPGPSSGWPIGTTVPGEGLPGYMLPPPGGPAVLKTWDPLGQLLRRWTRRGGK